METRGNFCRRDYYPDVDTLQRHAALARNEAIYRRMLAIARCREGAPVQAIVDESGYPHYIVNRWWHKHRSMGFSQEDRFAQHLISNAPE
jgi:hypothetical protein